MAADANIMEVPKRWDLPFSLDLVNEAERRHLSEAELDELLSKPPFCDMDAERFPRSLPLREVLRNDTRIRTYRDGDVVVRAGDYGNSAFLIIEGGCRAILDGLDRSVFNQSGQQRKSVWNSVKGIFTAPRLPEVRDASRYPQRDHANLQVGGTGALLVQDVPNLLSLVDDPYGTTTNTVMPTGTLFGELSALGRVQRAVSVVAADASESRLLEIRWQGLRELMRYDPALRDHVNALFRENGLQAALRNSPLLMRAKLTQEQWDQITQDAEFETFGSYDWFGTYKELRQHQVDPLSQEPVIVEEDQYANGLILIRAGFARLSRRHGKGESTFGYLGKGDVFGLAELMHNAGSHKQVSLQATLRAAGYADLVRIPTRTFEEILYPALVDDWQSGALPRKVLGEQLDRRTYERRSEKRSESSLIASDRRRRVNNAGPDMMEFLVENRFINGTATMMIDLDRCTRCDDCVSACASGHDNNPRFIRHGQVHNHFMVANACMHCEDPVCMLGCPTGAIHRREGDGEVVINDITCIGCGTCANSCPYDNIRMVNVRDQAAGGAIMVDPARGRPIAKATKCDLCADHHGGPACERACPHDALKRVHMDELEDLSKWLNR